MIVFATLVAIAAAVIMLQIWETRSANAKPMMRPIRIETEEELRRHQQNRRR